MDKDKEIVTPIFKTYIEVALELFTANPKYYTSKEQKSILSFAKFLDSGRVLNAELQMLALQQSRKIDGEVINALALEFGKDKCIEVIKKVYARHKHTKK